MKGAFEIFKRDLKNIFKNYGAIIRTDERN